MVSIQRVKWSAARIIFIIAAFGAAVSGGLLVFAAAPLYSWYFFNDLKFWKYIRFTYPVLFAGWRMAGEWLRVRHYRRIVQFSLSAPPGLSPDLSRVRIRDSWPEADGICGNCDKCCVLRNCPMLNTENHKCRSYGSFFWRYFNCGRFPMTSEQIQYYQCGKWEMAGSAK